MTATGADRQDGFKPGRPALCGMNAAACRAYGWHFDCLQAVRSFFLSGNFSATCA